MLHEKPFSAFDMMSSEALDASSSAGSSGARTPQSKAPTGERGGQGFAEDRWAGTMACGVWKRVQMP